MPPPRLTARPHTHVEHGVPREDAYAWVRDPEDPEILAHLVAENTHTAEATAHLAEVRRALFDELLGRIQEDDESVPVRKGRWWYVTRTVAGKPYAIHLRRDGAPDGPEQILLDENALAEGRAYLEVGALTVSPDGRRLAWSWDETGGEKYHVAFVDLDTGALLPDTLEDVGPGLVWAADGATLLYTRMDETLRPHELWAHRLGRTDDVRLLREDDVRFRVFASRSRDDRWLLSGIASGTTTEVHVAPATAPEGPWTVLSARHDGHEYDVEILGDRVLVLTNDADDADGRHTDAALGFALKEGTVTSAGRATWRTLVPAREGVTLEGVIAFETAIVLLEREDGLTHLRRIGADGSDRRVPMPDPSYVLDADSNPDPRSGVVRLSYTSLTIPASVIEVDLVTDVIRTLKVTPVRGGYDPARYVAERIDVPSHDGVRVPVSVVRRRDLPEGPAPTVLYAYGAYGLTIDPAFSSTRLSLLDRGAVYAIAHVRGGGFLGRAWKEAGRLARKPNTFHDVIAVADALIASGRTAPDRLALVGGSAGGMMVGAVLNRAADRFRCAVAQVPFVDVLTTMFDVGLPLTTNEWEEWGDPHDRAAYDVMSTYSPYDNVQVGPYPDLLVTAGLTDPRVMFWEPTKWVARLRDRATNQPKILLQMELEAGHGGKSGRYGYLDEVAFEQAWILDRLGALHPLDAPSAR
jgi:oligopeptidase B